MARSFTRSEFHGLVWSKPMIHLAKEFGLSDVALHKVCRKHAIPTPPLGWWAKKAAGKSVRVTPLPTEPGPERRVITIAAGHFGQEGSLVRDARERARVLAATDEVAASPTTREVIERTMSSVRRSKASDLGMASITGKDVIECVVARSSIDRLANILWAIAPAAATQGFEIAPGEQSACFRSGTETVTFSLKETVGREPHVLTEAELAKQAAWERKRDRVAPRHQWHSVMFERPRFRDWDYHPTGEFSLELETVYISGGSSPRRTFNDTRTQRLEAMGPDIGVGLAVLAAAKSEERRKREARLREAELEQQRRELLARNKFVTQRRTEGLAKLLAEVGELDRLRTLVGLLTQPDDSEGGPRVSALTAFALEDLATREAMLSPRGLEERLATVLLFGDDDDRDFRPAGRF